MQKEMGESWQKYFNFAHLEDSLGLEYLRHDKPLHPPGPSTYETCTKNICFLV